MQKNENELPNNKVLAIELGGKTELKKYMKRVMPFVQLVKEKMEVIGPSALNLTLDFDVLYIYYILYYILYTILYTIFFEETNAQESKCM